MNIFSAANKFHKKLIKPNSTSESFKNQIKNIFKYQNDFKLIFLYFSTVGNHYILFSIYFIFGEK